MQPSIFGKQLKDTEFSDVVAFCAPKPKEGLGLDYKKDLSSMTGVVKTLVSFANTNGGWLIVGVEDEDDAPKLPVNGMTYSDDLVQRVNNAIVSSVSPIAIPFSKVCKSADGKKAFLIAYMPQSQAAPHFMQYKGKHMLFIRVADRATGQDWESTASGSQWEMLRNRRQSSIELRDQLASSMKEVFKAKVDEVLKADEEIEKKNNSYYGAIPILPTRYMFSDTEYEKAQVVSILPAYPTTQVAKINSIEDMIANQPVVNGFSTYRALTPDHRGHDSKIYQFGSYAFHRDDRTKGFYFFGTDVFGNMINVDPMELSRIITPDDGGGKYIEHFLSADYVIMQIVGALKFANKTYGSIGLIGDLIFRVEFSGTKNCLMFPGHTGLTFNTHNEPRNITGQYLVQKNIDTNLLGNNDARQGFVLDVVKEILYSFNFAHVDESKALAFIRIADRDL